MDQLPTFQAGKWYGWEFYFTDQGGAWRCVKRTAKTVVMDTGFGKLERFLIKRNGKGEYIFGHSAFCEAKDEGKSFRNPNWTD